MSVDDSFVPNEAHVGEAGLYALAVTESLEVIKYSYLMVLVLRFASKMEVYQSTSLSPPVYFLVPNKLE